MKNINKNKAFTLAETLIALVILGVVAAITIPALINKYIESADRTKVKKAMASYEKALNQMIIENDVKGAVGAALNGSNCAITSLYFKAIEYAKIANSENTNNCRFQTSDKVWWDITDIEHPIIALNEEDLDNTNAENRFVLVGHLEDGILRINDSGFETTDPNKTYLTKLYNFINNVEDGGVQEPVDPTRACSDSTKNASGNYVSCRNIISQDDYHVQYEIYTENGNKISADCEFRGPDYIYCYSNVQLSENEKISFSMSPYNPETGEYNAREIVKYVTTEENGIEKRTSYNCEDTKGVKCSDTLNDIQITDKTNNKSVTIKFPVGDTNLMCQAYTGMSYLCQGEGYTHCESGPFYSTNGQTFCCKGDEHVVNPASDRYYCVKNE